MKNKRLKRFWIWILVAAYIAWIFSNSLQSGVTSSMISQKVASSLAPYFEKIGFYIGDFSSFHYFVRKMGHFAEFFGLGFLITLATAYCPLFKSRFLNFCLFLVAIPVSDELIQRYIPERSSQFSDMLIDGAGFLVGGLCGWLLYLLIKDLIQHFKNSSTEKTES